MMKKCLISLSFFLVFTFIFALTMFVIELILLNRNISPLKMSKSSNNSAENCLSELQTRLELKDLKQMKKSYLNELKRIEQKRNHLLNKLELIREKIEHANNELEQLNERNKLLTKRLIENQLSIEQFSYKQDDSSLITPLLNYSIIKPDISGINKIAANEMIMCSIEKCFNFAKCPLNRKLNLYLFNQPKVFELDLFELSFSIEFVSDPSQSCLVLVFLDHTLTNSPSFPGKLVEFIQKDLQNPPNFLFISLEVDSNRIESKSDLIRLLNSSMKATEEKSQITALIGRSLFASFNYSKQQLFDDLFVSFSIMNNQKRNLETGFFESFSRNNMHVERNYLLGVVQCRSNEYEVDGLDYLKKDSEKKREKVLFCGRDENCREKLFKESSFVLFMCLSTKNSQSEVLWSFEMSEALRKSLQHSSIPVFVDLDVRLPLSELIAWDEVGLRFPMAHLNHLLSLLKSFDQSELASRRIKARNLFNAYFESSTRQLRTLIASVQWRLRIPMVPLPNQHINEFSNLFDSNQNSNDYESMTDSDDLAQKAEQDENYEYYGKVNQTPVKSDHFTRNFSQTAHHIWNLLYYPFNLFPSLPFDSKHNLISLRSFESLEFDYAEQNFTYGGADGSTFHYYLSGNYQQEQFTLVVLTFKRESMLVDALSKYVKLPYLHSILVIWNAVEQEPSQHFVKQFGAYLKSARIRVIRSEKNSLNNRFLPYAHLIKTDAVLNLDDDTLLRTDEIMFAFRVWRENREKIVGFPARYHTWNFTKQAYEYRHDLSCEYSMILTGAAFYHQFYNYAFSFLMDKRIRDYIDSVNNCEDIAFNMLVSHLTRRPPLKVTLKYNFYCAECEMLSKNKNEKMAVSLQKGHYEQRTKCLQFFQSVYGYNPLLYSQFRADSVLYRTRLPADKQRCFKLI